jgi:hypothetical protein
LLLDRGEWSASRPGRFAPREKAPGIHRTGGWVGPELVWMHAIRNSLVTVLTANVLQLNDGVLLNAFRRHFELVDASEFKQLGHSLFLDE